MFWELIVLGLACLTAPICARWAGFETRHKPFDLVGAGGLFFLLGAAFNLAGAMIIPMLAIAYGLSVIAMLIGWLGLLIGAFWATGEVLSEPSGIPAHSVPVQPGDIPK